MTLRPCLTCGEPSERSRCPEHHTTASPHTLGYDAAWDRLSKRARTMQDFCSVPGCTSTDLTLDHSPEAWARKARGLAIRLQDVQVLCRSHNAQKGRAR